MVAADLVLQDGPAIDLENMECRVCKAERGREHVFREMMFSTRGEFKYWECLDCGCIQIQSIPPNLAEYYPNSYYSFSVHASRWKTWYYRAHFAAPGMMRRLRRCSADISSIIALKPKRSARILDVGSGGGRLVEILRAVGFDAHGIDPFLSVDGKYVRKGSIEDETGTWDVIMFHHSLEHMQNDIDVLRCARSRLAARGICLVRIPIAAWAWQHYGKDWVQLDAPRHLQIHTCVSFRLAAESAGFEVVNTLFDSNEFQFCGSERCARGLSLHEKGEIFSAQDLRNFRDRADKLNAEQQGDQAAFFLRPAE